MAKIEQVKTPFGMSEGISALKASYTPTGDAEAWPRVALYGGLLAENVTQAFAAAILRNALHQLDDVVLHVHDEICLEVPESDASCASENLTRVMTTTPTWAEGLPLAMAPKIISRYGK